MLKLIGQVILWVIKASVRKGQEDKGDFQETEPVAQQHWGVDRLKWVPKVEYPWIGVRNGLTVKIGWAVKNKAKVRREEVQYVSGVVKQQETAFNGKQLNDWQY
jgi:phage I-like protein